ncbi:MAG: response regulator SirA [Thermoplasmata archaeon M11B2D]|nr:MAG: response regulator SirA [Thermoplasmata archaeon M11B2D]PNX53098.1 MAG: response regulator SirA [Thermoplasmata archaeon M9B2D]
MTNTTIILHSEALGNGSDELGKTMTGSFLRKLWASAKKPDTIIFYNSAVHLLTTQSSVLDALTGLSKAGVDLVACQTCIGFYEIEKKLAIGRIIDMQEVVSILMKSDKVITP